MYIDKIYTKLYSNKDWSGLNQLIDEMRSFTRGIEKYKDFYEPGYDLIKAYRHEAAKRLLDKKHAPGYDPNDAFKAMQEAHNEAEQSPEIRELGRKVRSQATDELMNNFENSEFYKPEYNSRGMIDADTYQKQLADYKKSVIAPLLDENSRVKRSSIKEIGPMEFDLDHSDYDRMNYHDDPDQSYGYGKPGNPSPESQAYRWDIRKENDYNKGINEVNSDWDNAMEEYHRSKNEANSIPMPNDSAWNRIIGKYGKELNKRNEEVRSKVLKAQEKLDKIGEETRQRRKALEKDRANKSGIK